MLPSVKLKPSEAALELTSSNCAFVTNADDVVAFAAWISDKDMPPSLVT